MMRSFTIGSVNTNTFCRARWRLARAELEAELERVRQLLAQRSE